MVHMVMAVVMPESPTEGKHFSAAPRSNRVEDWKRWPEQSNFGTSCAMIPGEVPGNPPEETENLPEGAKDSPEKF